MSAPPPRPGLSLGAFRRPPPPGTSFYELREHPGVLCWDDPDSGERRYIAKTPPNGSAPRPAAPRPRQPPPPGNGRAVDLRPPPPPPAPEDDDDDLMRLVMRLRAVPGGRFILDAPATPAALWGEGDRLLWAEGEPMMLFGPTGTGKTTLMGQVVLGRLGLRSEVLGFPVVADERPVLYLACDRPSQVQRSFARMVGEADREVLDARLRFWKGPLPGNLAQEPDLLRKMADEAGAGTVMVDSLKDIAVKLSDDETGARVNNAFQALVADGVQVGVLHHPRKATGDNPKPTKISDVYGSTWLTAGMGSVLCLWGQGGDVVVELFHLKQPAEAVEPLQVIHDHTAGLSTVEGRIDLLAIVRTSNGLTAEGAARALFRCEKPERNHVEKARRRLDALVAKGLAHPQAGGKGAGGQQLPTRYYVVVKEPS